MNAGATIGGILLPESFLQTEFFAVLAAFVAVNTLIYVTLAVSKIFPRVRPVEWFHRLRGGANRRTETRSIFPAGYDPSGAGS